ARHGWDVALTARRLDRLDALAAELRQRHGVEALTLAADLADPAAPGQLIDAIKAQDRVVDGLVNNAGYGVPGAFDTLPWREHADFIQVMTTAPCELVHRVLPGMRARRFGRICNVASLAGLIPGAPGATLYGASKALMVRFSQSLHQEMAGAGVHVSALCPGFTYSEFHDANQTRAQINDTVPAWLWMGADEVAAAGYEAAEANRPICVTGAPNKALAALGKIVPDEWAMALMSSQVSRFRKV
ncbi:MAG TPA: SDR family NAD(P)-dependent oxidoreductase, partial [Caulobacteraceae bacterium]